MRARGWVVAIVLCVQACRTPHDEAPDPIAPLLEAFESDDPHVREAAGERLRELAPAYEGRLRKLLSEANDPEVRARLENALRPRPVDVLTLESHTYTMTVVSVSER